MVYRAVPTKFDIYDGDPWTGMDIRDLAAALQSGSTIEDAAKHLCRSGTVDEVRRKVEELGLSTKVVVDDKCFAYLL